jgi:hypothetical protein
MLLWFGAALTLAGIGLVLRSALLVLAARRAGLADAELRARIAAALPWNIGGFLLSVLGLALVGVAIAVFG